MQFKRRILTRDKNWLVDSFAASADLFLILTGKLFATCVHLQVQNICNKIDVKGKISLGSKKIEASICFSTFYSAILNIIFKQVAAKVKVMSFSNWASHAISANNHGLNIQLGRGVLLLSMGKRKK